MRDKLESKFQAELILDLTSMFDGCLIITGVADNMQGFPDLLILWKDQWAALEVKRSRNAERRPNQNWYVETLYDMSYAAFIYPENKDQILDELQQAFAV